MKELEHVQGEQKCSEHEHWYFENIEEEHGFPTNTLVLSPLRKIR